MRYKILFLLLLSFEIFGNQNPIINSFVPSSYSILPGGIVDLNLEAYDPDCPSNCTSGCGQYIRADLTNWSSNGGSFLNINNGTSSSPYNASAQWQAPLIEGTYNISIQISDSGTFLCGGRLSASSTIQITVTQNLNNPPVISSFNVSQNPLLINSTAILSVSASDPDGDPIFYEFSTNLGEIHPISEGVAEYIAPSIPGITNITCKVQDNKGAFTIKDLKVYITSVMTEKSIKIEGLKNYKISSDNYGFVYVPTNKNFIYVYNLNYGKLVKKILAPFVVAVSIDWNGNIFSSFVNDLKVLSRDGDTILDFNLPYNFEDITDVFSDNLNHKYLCLLSSQGKIAIFNENGNLERIFGGTGDGEGEFKKASGLAVYQNEIYAGDVGHGRINIFDYNGNFLRSFGQRGGEDVEFVQISSLDFDLDGNLYAVDTFKSQVIVFSFNGNLKEIFGKYGNETGNFIQPISISSNKDFGKILVLNSGKNSVEIFNLYSNSNPPANNIPSVPEPISPLNGTSFPKNSNVELVLKKSFDPDFQELYYSFELYEEKNNKDELLASWFIKGESNEISVDATPFLSKAGNYKWRGRAFDSIDWSGWFEFQSFTIESGSPNNPPSVPGLLYPQEGSEVDTLEPTLTISNAQDPDNDPLYYIFEVYLHNGTEGLFMAYKSDPVPQGNGLTSFKVPSGILSLSQEVFWRAVAFDGYLYSEYTPYFTFFTPPLPIPLSEEVGNIPSGDLTRPYILNFEIEPRGEDTKVYFQIFGSFNENEVFLIVNNNYKQPLGPYNNESWSFTESYLIPKEELKNNENNRISFENQTNKNWGLRKVTLSPPDKITLNAIPYNTVIDLLISSKCKNSEKIEIYKAIGEPSYFNKVNEINCFEGVLRDTGLQNGTTYFYFAIKKDSEGFESEKSNIVFGIPQSTSTTPITDLRLVKEGNNVKILWTSITNEPAIQHYEIYKDNFSNFFPDTQNFTNLYTTRGSYEGSFIDYNELLNLENVWYIIYPLSLNGERGMP